MDNTQIKITKNWNECLYFYLDDLNGFNIGRIGTDIKENKNYKKECEITYFILKPQYRKSGIGKPFFLFVLDYIKKLNFEKVYLTIEEDGQKWGKLEKYYKNIGFKPSDKEYIQYNGGKLFRYLPMEFFLSNLE